MKRNQIYELKNKSEVVKYIINNKLFEDKLFSVDEIGNGNMNYVYRIKELVTGKSFILKYAAKHIRISDDIMVSTDRIKIEAKVLTYLSGYAADYIPHIYQYDEINHCILMEDYDDFLIVRDLLVDFEQVPDFAEHVSTYLVKSILPTLELLQEEVLKKELIEQFSNPLCDITKTYVFTEPFDVHGSTNAIYEPNQSYIEQEIFQDSKLLAEIEVIKDLFSNKKQALLHGDLHTGSIFTNKTSVIVFDYEFAFFGPIGFDIGNLVANMIFAWLHAKAFGQRKDYIQWMEETIIKTLDLFTEKLILEWECYKADNAADHLIEITSYLKEILQDTASFAGVELIRRVVGIAHVADITSIDAEKERIRAERIAIQVAKSYILNKHKMNSGSDFVRVLREIERKID